MAVRDSVKIVIKSSSAVSLIVLKSLELMTSVKIVILNTRITRSVARLLVETRQPTAAIVTSATEWFNLFKGKRVELLIVLKRRL